MELRNKKWSEEDFFKIRKQVLSYKTADKKVDFKHTIEFLKRIPENKNFSNKLMIAKEQGITLVQLAVSDTSEEYVSLLKDLQDQSSEDLILTNIHNHGIQHEINKKDKFSVLNYSVEEYREIYESINLPLEATYSTPDSRLLVEMIHACGFTSSQGGGISHNIPYAKDASIEKSILDWQYCDRLIGFYQEQGISINREPFCEFTYHTLIPPSTLNAISIIEGLLSAEQGVKNITVAVRQCGNLIQDIASIKALEEQTNEYMKEYGYDDVCITTAFHQCMVEPYEDEAKTFGVISIGTVTAVLAGVTKIIVKSPKSTKKLNSAIIRATKMPLDILGGQRLAMSKELETEIVIIKAEVKCILDKVFELGEGDLAIGAVRAFETGVIDIPLAPSKYNAGKMTSARDDAGAIRYVKFGNIPLTQELKNFNRRKTKNGI
ncbi:methylaspartate mutase subunit E [Clostridium sp. WILCCON 0269]|uniref:Methylaspartate mutase subunit E n=1 Tax=Candidatus Clostridium eludens TaxID=3381663 RepID=A0ABW8SJC4_9CLOT